MKKLLIALFLALSLFSCKDLPVGPQIDNMIPGTVYIESMFSRPIPEISWCIEFYQENSSVIYRIYPYNLPQQFKVNGMKVLFKYHLGDKGLGQNQCELISIMAIPGSPIHYPNPFLETKNGL